MDKLKSERWTRNFDVVWTGILVAVLVGILGAVALALRKSEPPDRDGSAAVATPSHSASRSSAPVESSAAPSSEPRTTAPPQKRQYYLSDLEPVAGDFNTGPSTIGGNARACSSGVLFDLNTFSNGRSVEYNVPVGVATFEVAVGLDNGTESGVQAQLQVYLDDVPVEPAYRVDLYSVQEVKLSVLGKSRIKLVGEGTENGGGVGNVGSAVWCDAKFVG